ncbi:MAG: T9SS type A sorting domain-containing protein [Bacteroidia bacterium]
MKKIYLMFASCLFITGAFSQSQRLVLMEEFTQASCPPCASTNPALNALLDANATKVVSVKYQTSWPGYDPMNIQNPSQVQTRVTYYGVTGVPDGELDGGQGFSGQPGTMTQANIDSRYAVPSPFTIDVTHNLSANNDSIYCHATLTCSQAVSGTLKAHMAVIERNVYFISPPGTNGEKEFEGVMKKMLPSDQGTVLATSYNVGDVVNLDLSWALVSVYDINQLAIVVWIQDNTTQHVLQAGYSRPHITDDAGISKVNSPAICSANLNVNPVVNLHNYAINPLTQATINYKIDNGTVQSYTWNGTLATDGDALITLPSIAASSAGTHTITAYTSMPNGVADMDVHNDQSATPMIILAAPVVAPVTQDFVSTLFPPSGWSRLNLDLDSYLWARGTPGFGGSNGSAKMDFWSSPAGTIDNLYAPDFDYSTAVAGATLEFDLAHAAYDATTNDRLQVNISTDCGATWTTVYDKSDYSNPALTTHVGYVTGQWTAPNTTTDWRHEVISMDAFIGQADVIAEFSALSGYGNLLYVDNVNIRTAPLGINSISLDQHVNVYPVPSNGLVNLDVKFETVQNLKYEVYDLLGEMVTQSEIGKTAGGLYPIDLSKAAAGSYTVKISTDTESIVKAVNIVK